MTLHTPVYVQPVSGDPSFPSGIPFSAQELRRNTQAILAVASPSVQSGVTTLDGAFAVTQHAAGANFSVDVAAGHAFVIGTDIANQSAYGCWNDGVVNVPTPSAPASGTENHRLVLQIEDKYSNGVWTGYTANLNLLADTGSGTPAQPASSITLAIISISAGQASVLNANISDQRGTLLGTAPAQTDITHPSVAGTSPAALSKAWVIPANTAVPGAVYRLSVRGNGVQWSGASEDIVLQALVGSSAFANVQVHISSLMSAGSAFSWEAEVDVVIQTGGASGTCDVFIRGTAAVYGATMLAGSGSNTMAFVNQQTGEPFNTTIANNLELQGNWTLTSGSGGSLNSRVSVLETL